jgi:phytoene dehydrogenase-like protein
MTNQHYDLIVVGSGPAGQKGAINAAKLGKQVAVVEGDGMMGGVSTAAPFQVKPCARPFSISRASPKERWPRPTRWRP